jgi:hypothetical protein
MREWKLQAGDPLSLTLASDARLGPTNYLNDHIWELFLQGGEPEALALQTTYGLRAKSFRVFPRFREKDITINNPEQFAQEVTIQKLFPNYIALNFSPLEDIDVNAEYWVPQPHTIAIRLKVINSGKTNHHIRVEWVGQLSPNKGQRMAGVEIEAATVLCGETDQLQPVMFITGSPKEGSGSYPSLTTEMELAPDATRQFTCVVASLDEQQDSFSLARSIAALNWEAKIAHLEMLNSGHIEVYTGNNDWDAAFLLSQKLGMGLIVGPTQHLPHPSFVFTRRPDQGYSLTGDGFDYDHFWNGQTPLESYYLASLILPIAPEFIKGLLHNYLAVQEEDGTIDWEPGLAGQRCRQNATPILASLAWKIHHYTEDPEFLEEIYSGLLLFLKSWFTESHDRDGDGIPEWDNPLQMGADDHPIYSDWQEWAQSVDISTAEGPALCGFLYSECQALIQIGEIIGRKEEIGELEELSEKLHSAIEGSWDEDSNSYYDWDRDTHHSTEGELLGGLIGSGVISIQREFKNPIRLQIHIRSQNGSNRNLHIFIHGSGASGKHRVERITYEDFKWTPGRGRFTGQLIYSSLERIDIQGLEEDDEITLDCIGYRFQNQTLLTPLWAGIPEDERAQQLIEKTITNPDKFWRPFGLPDCPDHPEQPQALIYRSTNLIWNLLVGEGLVKYGYRRQAAELVNNIMNAVVQGLKEEQAFHQYYNADSGQGIGVHNSLSGLAPLGLFLEVLGVQLISSKKVVITDKNPFEGPVTVKYRGLTVLRQREKSTIIFPDGQTVEVEEPGTHTISLEEIHINEANTQ